MTETSKGKAMRRVYEDKLDVGPKPPCGLADHIA
jgi:hypothetical protein